LPEVHLELGEVYAGAFQWAKAEEEFRRKPSCSPEMLKLFTVSEPALLEQGRVHEARAELLRANKLMPDMPEHSIRWGKLLRWRESRRSRERMDKLLSIEKDSSLAARAFWAGRSL